MQRGEHLRKLFRHHFRKSRQHLAHFHHGTAHVPHRAQQLQGGCEMGLAPQSLLFPGVRKSAAQPVGNIAEGHLRVERAQ